MTAFLIALGIIAVILLITCFQAIYNGLRQDDEGDVYDKKGKYICNWPIH